jgi:hypothetical protein
LKSLWRFSSKTWILFWYVSEKTELSECQLIQRTWRPVFALHIRYQKSTKEIKWNCSGEWDGVWASWWSKRERERERERERSPMNFRIGGILFRFLWRSCMMQSHACLVFGQANDIFWPNVNFKPDFPAKIARTEYLGWGKSLQLHMPICVSWFHVKWLHISGVLFRRPARTRNSWSIIPQSKYNFSLNLYLGMNQLLMNGHDSSTVDI